MPITCTPPDVCQCESCAPAGTYPEGPPESAGHAAIRFVGTYPGHERDQEARIVLNGEDVSAQVNEGCPGYRGYVVAAPLEDPNEPNRSHRCRTCGQNVCVKVIIGRVETRRVGCG